MNKGILMVLISGVFLFTGKVYAAPAMNALNNENNEAVFAPGDKTATNYPKGAEIYNRKCVACHQLNGEGIPGTFPPLKGSDFLKSATKKRLIEQVMNGSNEQLTVNGTTYSSPMPPQVDNAGDAVAVVNYILNSWGNHYGKASPQDAKNVKPVKAGRNYMMNGRGMMQGWGRGMTGRWGTGFWWIGGLVFMGLLAWLIVVILRRSAKNHYHEESALEILKERYARGEISKEEFDRMSRDLR